MALAAGAVEWNLNSGRLEDSGSWQGGVAPGLTAAANFGAGTYTVSSDSGFTNGVTTAGGKNAKQTFALAPGATYSMEHFSLPSTAATEAEPSVVTFQSGTFEVRTNNVDFLTKANGGNYNRLTITNATFKTLGQAGAVSTQIGYNSRNNAVELLAGGVWQSAMGFKIEDGTNSLIIAGAGARYEHNSATATALELSIDGGGNTFAVMDGGTFKANGNVRCIFGINAATGGTFTVSGAQSAFDFTSTVTQSSADNSPFTLGRGSKDNVMKVEGGARVSLNGTSTVIGGLNGADRNRLLISGQSLMTNNAVLNVGYGAGSGAHDNEVQVDGSTLVVNNSLAVGGQKTTGARVLVTNGAVCKITGAGVYKSIAGGSQSCGTSVLDGSQFMIDSGTCQIGGGGLDGYFIVDGKSSLTVSGDGKNTLVGDYINNTAGTNNVLLIQGGSTFSTAGDVVVGNGTGAAYNRMILANATNALANTRDLYVGKKETAHYNSAWIGSGGVLKTPRNILLGGYDGSTGNSLVVSNGLIQLAGSLYVGTSSGSATFASTRSNAVVVCGTTTKITGAALVVKNQSILEFKFGADAAAITAPPLEFTGAATLDATSSIKISAERFSRAGGGTVPLFKYGSGAFDEQAVATIIEPADLDVSFSQVNRIVYAKIPSRGGTVISIR